MFSPLQRVCRKVSAATVFQLRHWARSWPRRARRLMAAHEVFLRLNGDKVKSPFINPTLTLLGGVEFIKAEIDSRVNRTPNSFDFAKYEIDTLLSERT